MLINEITLNPTQQTFEILQNNLTKLVISNYNTLADDTANFTIHARDFISQDEINDFIYDYTALLQRIADSNLTTSSQTYKVAFAILDYFKQ